MRSDRPGPGQAARPSAFVRAVRLWAKPALFLSLTLGPIIAYPAWYHHDIKLNSPVFESEAGVRGWLDAEKRQGASACIPRSIEEKVEPIADRSGWFAEFRCNTPAVYVRLVLAFVMPGLVALMLAAGLLGAQGKRRA